MSEIIYYEVLARDERNVPKIVHTFDTLELAREWALAIPARFDPRVYAIYANGDYDRIGDDDD